MENGAVAGPSRPPRRPAMGIAGDLADRIVALQRKNAAAGPSNPSSRHGSVSNTAPRRPPSPSSSRSRAPVVQANGNASTDDFSRNARASSSKLFDPMSDSHKPLAAPTPRHPSGLSSRPSPGAVPMPTSHQEMNLTRGPRVASPGPIRRERERDQRPHQEQHEYSRGPLPDSAQRVLFDPSRPNPPLARDQTRDRDRDKDRERDRDRDRGGNIESGQASHMQSHLLPPPRMHEGDDRRRRPMDPPASSSRRPDPSLPSHSPLMSLSDLEDRRYRSPGGGGGSGGSGDLPRRPDTAQSRMLFDPNHPDPAYLQPRSQQQQHQQQMYEGSSAASSRTLSRLTGQPRTREEELDRERERRKRKEGSERGMSSTTTASRKKDSSDSRSKGSRSSEGSESFKDRERGKGKSDGGVKAILKDLYDKIKILEQELTEVHRRMAQDPEAGISILLDRPIDTYSREIRTNDYDTSAWLDLIDKHKHLGDLHHEFLVRVFDPLVPSSLHQLTVRYNIPSRLWQAAFHLILERLRHAWMSSQPAALDLLTDLVYHAYKFYTELLEDQSLANFRTAWIEALGDLARYRMAIAARQASEVNSRPLQAEEAATYGRIDDDGEPESSGASIGAEVAQSWDVEDKETWRTTARDWYTMGITEKPGEGRLHHHLALLSRDIRGQEARALHHFTKSLTVTHEFDTSRESILPLFDSALQTQRSLPDATALDLFVRLHGMLFTRISLDDFPDVMSRFMERLEEDAQLDGVRSNRHSTISTKADTITQVEWMLMASVNISAVLQYGSTSGIIRKALAEEGVQRRKLNAVVTTDEGEIQVEGQIEGSGDSDEGKERAHGGDGPRLLTHEPPSLSFTYALQLAFGMLEHGLQHPNRFQGIHPVLNPYITLMLTFVATLFRQPQAGAVILPSLPWHRLVEALNSMPEGEIKEETRLINGPPLPEDWTIRGMEWVGRRVYERGFWKAKGSSRGSGSGGGSGTSHAAQPQAQPSRVGERFQSEMDVLLANFDAAMDLSEGVVEELEGTDMTDGPVAVNQRRWRRVAWAGGVLVKHVDGFDLEGRAGDGVDGDSGKVVIVGSLAEKLSEMEAARLEEEQAQEANRLRALAKARERYRYTEEDDSGVALGVTDSAGDGNGENDDPDLVLLRERRRQLQQMVATTPESPANALALASAKHKIPRAPVAHAHAHAHTTNAIPGYTMLVFDTNVLLSSLVLFSRLVESGQWSIIVPLPVVTELDGLSKEPAPLGTSAKAAVQYLENKIRSHGKHSSSLKIQTTKGNYLSDLLIRTENHQTASTAMLQESNSVGGGGKGNMDDRILSVAVFQQEHFMDRSGLLRPSPSTSASMSIPTAQARNGSEAKLKVLLVTFDRNLRLKARSRGIEAADEKEMEGIWGS